MYTSVYLRLELCIFLKWNNQLLIIFFSDCRLFSNESCCYFRPLSSIWTYWPFCSFVLFRIKFCNQRAEDVKSQLQMMVPPFWSPFILTTQLLKFLLVSLQLFSCLMIYDLSGLRVLWLIISFEVSIDLCLCKCLFGTSICSPLPSQDQKN